MAGARYSIATSQGIGTGSAENKGILMIKAPAAAPMVIRKNATISFDGTNATAGKVRVTVRRGGTDGTGTNVTPAALVANNPANVTAPTAKENYAQADIPTGGTIVFDDFVEPYRTGFVLPLAGIVLAGGELLWVGTNSPTSLNARVNFPDVEV